MTSGGEGKSQLPSLPSTLRRGVIIVFHILLPLVFFGGGVLLILPMCSSRKYPYSPTEGFLFCTPSPPGNSNLAPYYASKLLAFKSPLPLGISDDLPWCGCGFYLELHNSVSISRKKNFFFCTHFQLFYT